MPSNHTLLPFRFGDFLIEKSAISEAELLDCLAEHWMSGCPLGESVAKKGYLSAGEVERLIEEFQALSVIYV